MSRHVKDDSSFMALIEIQLLPNWFELDPFTRKDYGDQLFEIIIRHSEVDARIYDGDAWSGELSDFLICEFNDLASYNNLWSEMRTHPFLATPFARIGEVLMGMELDVDGLAQLDETPESHEGKSCSFCHHRLKQSARFCSLCGRKQETSDLA